MIDYATFVLLIYTICVIGFAVISAFFYVKHFFNK